MLQIVYRDNAQNFWSEVIVAAWSSFRVGEPSTKRNWTNADCVAFASVGHVAHLDVAFNIIQEHRLKPGLVFGDSRLNTSRTLVAWLSPNYWSHGFRYGSVKFDFAFRDLVKDKRTYWVEVIEYEVTACRILITDQDYDGKLTPYNPEEDDGPWRFDREKNKDFYNSTICLEFMFENEILLDSLSDLSFVDHHDKWCSMHRNSPSRCKEKGKHKGVSGASFVAKIVAAGLDASNVALLWLDEEGAPDMDFSYALNFLGRRLSKNVKFEGELSHNDDAADALARAALNALAIDELTELQALACAFSSESEFLRAVARLIQQSLAAGNESEMCKALLG